MRRRPDIGRWSHRRKRVLGRPGAAILGVLPEPSHCYRNLHSCYYRPGPSLPIVGPCCERAANHLQDGHPVDFTHPTRRVLVAFCWSSCAYVGNGRGTIDAGCFQQGPRFAGQHPLPLRAHRIERRRGRQEGRPRRTGPHRRRHRDRGLPPGRRSSLDRRRFLSRPLWNEGDVTCNRNLPTCYFRSGLPGSILLLGR
jgi:hypothetical protein